jgi:hypothetical protein
MFPTAHAGQAWRSLANAYALCLVPDRRSDFRARKFRDAGADIKTAASPISGSEMHTYRAFILDENGQVQKAIILDSTEDAEAIETGKRLLDGHDIEVWEGERVVAKLFHKDWK